MDLAKIAENANRVVTKCGEKGIDVIGVTKGVSAAHQIVAAMVAGGINGLADVRMENIIELRNKNFNNPMTLLRIPRLSNVDNVVKYGFVEVSTNLNEYDEGENRLVMVLTLGEQDY